MGREDYSFYGQVRAAIRCRDPEVVLSGPADTGKTLGILWKLNAIAEQRPVSIVIARKQLTDVYSTVIQTFQNKILGEDRASWPCSPYGGEKPQWYDYPGGARIWVAGLDKPGKVLSAEHDIIYVNQAEQCSLIDWETLTTRTTGRAGHIPYNQVIADCNPSHPTHWIRTRARTGALTLFESTHRDNPELYDQGTGEITPEGKRRLAALKRLTGARLLRLYHGLWSVAEGAIYGVFDEAHHVVKAFDPPKLWPRAVGIDPFGAYTAAVWVAYDPENAKLNVYREYLKPFGLTVGGHSENFKKLSQGEPVFRWVCGAKSERSWRLEYQASGIPVTEPPIVDVWLGIDRIYQLLKDWQLVVHDSCPGLLSEIGSYRRKMDRAGNVTDTIEDKSSFHLLDALRYVIAALTQPAATEEVIDLIRPIV
jgi:phage terminase large subunit